MCCQHTMALISTLSQREKRRVTMHRHAQTPDISRRTFLTTTGAALVGAALGGLASQSAAAQRHPQRGGGLQFGSRTDIAGLDAHRHRR